jgi:hypothetical protein
LPPKSGKPLSLSSAAGAVSAEGSSAGAGSGAWVGLPQADKTSVARTSTLSITDSFFIFFSFRKVIKRRKPTVFFIFYLVIKNRRYCIFVQGSI